MNNIVCSGALFYTLDTHRFLFLFRANGKKAGLWGLVGGTNEGVETPFEGLQREIKEEIGDRIQSIGKEFGATTGRKRRCGWLDLPSLKYSAKASAITSIALTKLDVLSGLEELKVCYAYELDGKEYDCAYPGLDLSQAKPLYKSLTPFKDDFSKDGIYAQELVDYIELIEQSVGIPVGILAYGPERSQIHFRKKYF